MPNEKDLMEWMSHEQILICRACGNHRVEMSFDDIPPARQAEFDVAPETIDYCLYCSHCDEYSVIAGGGSSWEDRAPKSKSFIGTPSRNKPCPCGSGRQYKRCCGK